MSQWRDFEQPETHQWSNYEQPESSNWRNYERPESSARVRLNKTELERQELKKKSLELMEETNRAFKELTATLSNEQLRLSELEEKRRRLLQQMMALKADIEKEREACRLELQEKSQDEAVSVETWHALNEEQIDRKMSLLTNRGSGVTMSSDEPKSYADSGKLQSREEITNDIVNRLTEFAKRSSNNFY